MAMAKPMLGQDAVPHVLAEPSRPGGMNRAPSMKDFAVCGVLGEGAFGRVMMAMAKDTQQVCDPPGCAAAAANAPHASLRAEKSPPRAPPTCLP